LRIEIYFQQIRQVIDECVFLQLSTVTYDERGAHEGFIRGELDFGWLSAPLARVCGRRDRDRPSDVRLSVMGAARSLIFRYDDTGHHKELGLPTYPNHKHEGSEDNVVSSSAPDLASILGEIEALVQLL
jgi:hypothetical protein